MNTDMTLSVSTTNSAATKAVGQQLARLMAGREVVELVGDLGAGKTTLVQGLLEGLGYNGEAPSPTFTLGRVYKVHNGLELHHFDLYRLAGHDLVSDELAEVAGTQSTITVAEWADHGAAKLPPDRLQIKLSYGEAENDRELKIVAGGELSQRVVKGLSHVPGA